MSMPLTPPALPSLSGYTAPKLPSLASAQSLLENAADASLTGGAAAPATAGASQSEAATPFHRLLQQAMAKTVQGMARSTATQAGIHPDQSGAPTNAQAVTGHAVSITV